MLLKGRPEGESAAQRVARTAVLYALLRPNDESPRSATARRVNA
jgi:hypothetical protein